MSKPVRSQSESATRKMKIRGSGIAASIRDHPGEHQNGTAATFEEARADFESAWQVFLSKRTEADFQAYSLWDAGKLL